MKEIKQKRDIELTCDAVSDSDIVLVNTSFAESSVIEFLYDEVHSVGGKLTEINGLC